MVLRYKSVNSPSLAGPRGRGSRCDDTAYKFIRPMTCKPERPSSAHRSTWWTSRSGYGSYWIGSLGGFIVGSKRKLYFGMVHGGADNLLGAVLLATSAKVVVAPAMNQAVWSQATTENIKTLKSRDVVLDPDAGPQACGDVGPAVTTTREVGWSTAWYLWVRVIGRQKHRPHRGPTRKNRSREVY